MDSPDELDLIIIGAGFSGRCVSCKVIDMAAYGVKYLGVCALIRTLQRMPKAKVAVYEKEDSVAGTWAKNTYPGLSCDIPSQVRSSAHGFLIQPEAELLIMSH